MSAATSTFVDINDPAFDQVQELKDPYQYNIVAQLLHKHGLENKAWHCSNCGRVWKAKCPNGDGVRKRKRASCNGRFCPECGAEIIGQTMKRNAHRLAAIQKAHGNVVLCRIKYKSPFPLSDIDSQAIWLKSTCDNFVSRWDNYLKNAPARVHMETTSFAGFERIGGDEYLVLYAFLHTRDAEHKHKFRAIWPNASDVWVDRGGSHLSSLFFERALAVTKDSDAGERRAYHEILFHGIRQVQTGQMDDDLFPSEPENLGNNSSPDAGKKSPQWPRVPFCCDICGAKCVTSLEDAYVPEPVPIDKMRLALSD